MLSKFTGWVTIDEQFKFTRKTAPEVGIKILNENQKLKLKPSWMAVSRIYSNQDFKDINNHRGKG